MVITGVVNNFIEGETVEQKGKNKQREERERKMAAEAELEKLVDKDWRERMAHLSPFLRCSGQGSLFRGS
jgi:hypothetical protein